MHRHRPLEKLASEYRARTRHAASFLAPVLLGLITVPFAAAQEQTAAVLKHHEVDFFYRSAVAPFSCDALERRVMSVLHALGAREDIRVDASNCNFINGSQATIDVGGNSSDRYRSPSDPWAKSSDPFGSSSDRFRNRRLDHEQSSHVRIRLMMPVEVTPEVLEELKKDKSRRELISRVTDNPNVGMDEPIIFPARRENITLSRRTIDLEPEECELLEQMSRSVFRELGLRVVKGHPSCDRDRVSRIPPQLTVEALMPIMPSVPQLTPPGEGESEEVDPSG
jgi:hypothetical protein